MTSPVRKGIPVTLSLPEDALTLLRVMAPNRKTHGIFLGELLRAEIVRRETRTEMLRELRRTVEEALND